MVKSPSATWSVSGAASADGLGDPGVGKGNGGKKPVPPSVKAKDRYRKSSFTVPFIPP